ncbi:unnamed protein product [Angiostrongylus costaricensis]|uniref:Uncharacterized protein n=1 Tax=Angiostrongylus costaricensis TaxID=334426 RepID=A0A3P7HM61_ANGCS|nr:unnamed protein product [Angiostrongylus costaricensis]
MQIYSIFSEFRLAAYVYEYLVISGATKTAEVFKEEVLNVCLIGVCVVLRYMIKKFISITRLFWDLYCAAPERRDGPDGQSTQEAKAFHDFVSNPHSTNFSRKYPYKVKFYVLNSVIVISGVRSWWFWSTRSDDEWHAWPWGKFTTRKTSFFHNIAPFLVVDICEHIMFRRVCLWEFPLISLLVSFLFPVIALNLLRR